MIIYKKGNLLESDAEALVNTVNTEGVMGKGIALQFKNMFPNNYKSYREACKYKDIDVGKLFVTEDESLYSGKKIIINFPTKKSWRKPSEYSYIEAGLKELRKEIVQRGIESVAIPPLGSGNGGLEWNKVKTLLEQYLSHLETEIQIYEPNPIIKETLKKERVKLTPARAMLLSVLYDLAGKGEFVSEFSSEKVAYFLQRFGGKDAFNLNFKANFYGPYSGKVRHVLYYLNGSYITGYSSKNKKPFEALGLVADGKQTVMEFLEKQENKEYNIIVSRTKAFLSGFYSAFGLELLSTIDFIMQEHHVYSKEEITQYLEKWSSRKKTKFSNPAFVQIALENIKNQKPRTSDGIIR